VTRGGSGTRADIQFGDFRDRRRGEEKVDESWRLIDERAVGSHAQARQRRGGVEKILGSGTDRCKKRCFERRGHKRLEIVQADVGVRIFRRNHLALLGEPDVTIHGFGGLRQDGLIARAATASNGAAAPMKEPERNPSNSLKYPASFVEAR